jgi:hypothetical protein
MGDQREQLVGARAADDPPRIEAVFRPDGLAQAGGRPVRVEFEMIGGPDGPRGVSFEDSLWIFATPAAALLPGT